MEKETVTGLWLGWYEWMTVLVAVDVSGVLVGGDYAFHTAGKMLNRQQNIFSYSGITKDILLD